MTNKNFYSRLRIILEVFWCIGAAVFPTGAYGVLNAPAGVTFLTLTSPVWCYEGTKWLWANEALSLRTVFLYIPAVVLLGSLMVNYLPNHFISSEVVAVIFAMPPFFYLLRFLDAKTLEKNFFEEDRKAILKVLLPVVKIFSNSKIIVLVIIISLVGSVLVHKRTIDNEKQTQAFWDYVVAHDGPPPKNK